MPSKDTGGGIIRVAHDARNPYTVINRTFTEDPALSWEARGLLAYLLCKPNDWEVRSTDLIRRGNAGRLMMRRMLQELETAGYLVRTCSRGPGGRWVWVSTVYEAPGVGQPPPVERTSDEPPRGETPAYIVGTVPNSNVTEYRGEAAPLSKINAPSAFAVQAGTAPSRATGPEERRR